MFPYERIEKRIGYTFQDKSLLQEAFTHISYAHVYNAKSNERLEYLGDTVLQLIVTEWQYQQDKTANEGQLTRQRQKLVCKDALDSAVDGLGIWDYLLSSGKSRYNVGEKAKSSLFEAVTAAIYLDGGYEAAKTFVLKNGNLRLDIMDGNPIGDLKEFLEKRGLSDADEYWEKTGADNFPTFRCTLTAMGESAKGEGRTKREAKATAAARLMWELQKKPLPESKKKKK